MPEKSVCVMEVCNVTRAWEGGREGGKKERKGGREEERKEGREERREGGREGRRGGKARQTSNKYTGSLQIHKQPSSYWCSRCQFFQTALID